MKVTSTELNEIKSSFYADMLWSSSLQLQDLGRVRSFLTSNGLGDADLAIVSPPVEGSVRMRFATFYDADGNCVSTGYETPIPAGTTFLKMTFRYASARQRDAGHGRAVSIANALRLVFGVPVARELVIVSHRSADQKEGSALSDVGYASMFDSQSLNIFDGPPIEGAILRQIPPEASALLDAAFAQPYPRERFILMWLAFEAVVSSLGGPGRNGDKRRRYYVEELGSQKAGDEIFKLFQIRNELFKEGKSVQIAFEEHCWSLYAALQLAVLQDCPQRSAFLAGYEAYVSSR